MFGKYTAPTIITDKISTNTFSYNEREKLLGRAPEIILTPRVKGSRDDVILGNHTVIEEIDHNNALQSRTGLKQNVYIDGLRPVAVMDNHNHALGIWRELITKKNTRPTVIHIDAHADLEPSEGPFPNNPTEDNIRNYTHNQTHIGSFIPPALESDLITDCIQVRSSYTLENLPDITDPIILDIDLDFWALEDKISQIHLEAIEKITHKESCFLITIATSPYFLDQDKAMRFIDQLKPHL